jgi:glycosyltransferase involved in cell wall biosynthesis
LLAIIGRSLIYVGTSKTDGISTSMLEALASGATPVQTDTACAAEWFDHLKQGILVNSRQLTVDSLKEDIENAFSLTPQGLLGPDDDYPEMLRKRISPQAIMLVARQFYNLQEFESVGVSQNEQSESPSTGC